MNKTFIKLVVIFIFVIGISLIPNFKADAAVTVQVYATPSTITAGNSSTITWSSTGATSCIRTDTGASVGVSSATGFTVSPTTTTTYTIHCVGKPDTPTGFTVSPRLCGSGTIDVWWNAVSGVNGYILMDNGSTVYTGTATLFTQSGLSYGSYHSYTVMSYDAESTSTVSVAVGGTVAGACAPVYYYYDLTPCSGNPVYPTHYQIGPFIMGTYQLNQQVMGAVSPTYRYFISGQSTTSYPGEINIQTSNTGKTNCMP